MRSLVFLLLAAASMTGWAADPGDSPAIEAGLVAHGSGDYATAVRIFKELAKSGNAEAQFFLGELYASGEGVRQSLRKALKWYRASAEQGHVEARYCLGAMYELGRGVPTDQSEGVRWIRMAAEQGYPKAQTTLGASYAAGDGVPQDDAQALSWYRRAAEQDDPKGQGALALMYMQGQGVPADNVQAYMWFCVAARGGTGQAEGGVALDGTDALSLMVQGAHPRPGGDKVEDHDAMDYSHCMDSGGWLWTRIFRDAANKMLSELEESMSREEIAEARRLADEWLARRRSED